MDAIIFMALSDMHCSEIAGSKKYFSTVALIIFIALSMSSLVKGTIGHIHTIPHLSLSGSSSAGMGVLFLQYVCLMAVLSGIPIYFLIKKLFTRSVSWPLNSPL